MFRCFYDDRLLALNPQLAAVHPGGGVVASSGPDSGWREGLGRVPPSCLDCAGIRFCDEPQALLSLQRRRDGARIVGQIPDLPAGNLPAGKSAAGHSLRGPQGLAAGCPPAAISLRI